MSSRLLGAGILLGLSLFLFLWGLGRIPFYTKGEAREALVVWEEVHSGEWILPLRNGHELPSKPPLFHWLGGLTALVRGEVDELSVRFPSALLATGAILAVYWLGAAKWGPAAGLYAGIVLATSFEWLRSATAARVDMTLTALLTGALVALDRVVSSPAPRLPALASFYACMGLAALAKGPVGILLPSLVALVYLALRGDLGRLRRMHPVAGGVFTLAIAGSWYAAAIATGGEAFVQKQIVAENFARFFAPETSGIGHVHGWAYLVGTLFAGLAPWSLFLPPLAIYLFHHRRRLEALGALFPVVWFAVIFVFYALSESKRSVYLLPIYPAVSLLLGVWWTHLVDRTASMPPAVDRILQVAGVLAAVVLLGAVAALVGENLGAEPLAWIEPWLHPGDQANLPVVRHILQGRFVILAVWVAVLIPVVVLFLWSVHRGRWAHVFASLVAFVASSLAVVNAVFHPELAWRRTFKPLMQLVRELAGEDDRLVFYRTFDYGSVFYSGRHIPEVEDLPSPAGDAERTYVLLWEHVWDRLGPEERSRLEFLYRSDGTGPKGRDRLVLAKARPASGD